MRNILIIFFLLAFNTAYSQITKMIQVKNQVFQMHGVQNGEPVEKKTNVFGLTVNYETGEIKGVVNLVQLDLLNKGRESSADPEEDALKIRGFLPMNDILYNRQEKTSYKVELELSIKEFTVTELFEFTIIYVKNSMTNFHDVLASSTVNLSNFKVKDTNGFEPEVNIIFSFQMMSLQR